MTALWLYLSFWVIVTDARQRRTQRELEALRESVDEMPDCVAAWRQQLEE